jgi:hypothetical protein
MPTPDRRNSVTGEILDPDLIVIDASLVQHRVQGCDHPRRAGDAVDGLCRIVYRRIAGRLVSLCGVRFPNGPSTLISVPSEILCL